MSTSQQDLWNRFQKRFVEFPSIGLSLDLSRMNFSDNYFAEKQSALAKAFAAMAELEKGGLANPDEKRMAGHYWLRNPALAPSTEIRKEIEQTLAAIQGFAARIHDGTLKGGGGLFKNLLVIGIGGSALGPQFVASALGQPGRDKMRPFFFDNTDPDGFDKVLGAIGREIGQTLTVVISKSGGTKETRNGMLEAKAAYEKAGQKFAAHAVAVTGLDSELDKIAAGEKWLERFPMWDWVGGRTSETSAVGLLPAALQGIDIDQLLGGAKACDEITRQPSLRENPSAQLALAWLHATGGKGAKDMVILPYKDRLELFSKYLQQLIMESLGKEKDNEGKIVNQGIAVYGNKGSTDQHAYIQQLRDGMNNFFATFIQVLQDRAGASMQVEPNVTSGDYLLGFYLGTRQALYEKGRESITLTIKDVSPFSVGVLIALYERAVGFYATLVNINAYHQPGVEAGKKAATAILKLQIAAFNALRESSGCEISLKDLAAKLKAEDQIETLFRICEHLAANQRGIRKAPASTPFNPCYVAD